MFGNQLDPTGHPVFALHRNDPQRPLKVVSINSAIRVSHLHHESSSALTNVIKCLDILIAAAKLYPPRYTQNKEAAVESVILTLLNLARPSRWDEVSDWIDRHGPIANNQLRDIAHLDTLAASKQLRNWVMQGVLVALPSASRQQARYTKPELVNGSDDSLSLGLDNEVSET